MHFETSYPAFRFRAGTRPLLVSMPHVGTHVPPSVETRLSDAALVHEGKLALVELQNGDAAPSYVAGTANFYAVTRYNWSSYYALAVIELGEAVARELAREEGRSAR